MTPIGIVHIGFGVLSLVLGALVLALPKGTQRHRVLGYAYVISMVLLNGTAFGIYRLLGHFGPFHALALISLGGLLSGILPVLRKPVTDGAMIGHLMGIGWSYVGLWAATAAEVAVRLPAMQAYEGGTATGTVVGTAVVMIIGGGLLSRYRMRLIHAMQSKTQRAPQALPGADDALFS
ncbi:MAG: DUF2306 domain-containing protein [Akkermansiaceae bacterium]|nr:DUF2306 domain-containing protein [Armatimonadota bacterium]